MNFFKLPNYKMQKLEFNRSLVDVPKYYTIYGILNDPFYDEGLYSQISFSHTVKFHFKCLFNISTYDKQAQDMCTRVY